MPSLSKPFAGRGRVADLTAGSVFELRTEAVLSSAAPIPIGAIDPNPRNPRQAIARDEAFAELVESIRQHGLLQPVLVRRDGVRRILIAGHRRVAAIQQLAAETPEDARWRKILAVERIADEDQAFVLALVENLHREDLSAQDEASALEALEQELGSLQAVANAIKRSKAYVSRRIRTYQDPVLAAAVLDSGLAPTTAQEFLPVKDGRRRRELVQDALREGWDAPQARAAVKERCDSQQRSGYQGTAADRCESQQDSKSTSAESGARSRIVVRRVQGLRAVLDAGPLSALSPEAVGNLRAFATYLAEHLSPIAKE
jgi:ParB family transcriptional regulator, chromosome partitioning protein